MIIMIIMICGLAYDRFIARPGCEKGFETVQNLVQKNVAASIAEESISNLSVQKALGKEPATTTTTEDYTIETYRWPRGLVGLSYTVYVIYQPDAQGELVVYAPYLNREPPVAELPGYVLPKENIVVAKENSANSIGYNTFYLFHNFRYSIRIGRWIFRISPIKCAKRTIRIAQISIV